MLIEAIEAEAEESFNPRSPRRRSATGKSLGAILGAYQFQSSLPPKEERNGDLFLIHRRDVVSILAPPEGGAQQYMR